MDTKLIAGYISSGADLANLPDVVAASGAERKDVSMIRYMVEGNIHDLRTALTDRDPAASARAVSRISDDLSMNRERIDALVNEIRKAMGLGQEEKADESAVVVNSTGNNTYTSRGGIMFKPSSAGSKMFDMVRYFGSGGKVVVPHKINFKDITYVVNEIADNAFRNTDVTSVTIEEGYLAIGDGAFDGCDSLEAVSMPGSVSRIGSGAFRSCPKLRSIVIDEGNESYRTDGQGTLYTRDMKCLVQAPGGLEGEASVPDGVEEIRSHAFMGCSGVTGIALPPGLKRIGTSAFSGCSSLKAVRLPSTVVHVGEWVFNGCDSLLSITAEDGNARYSSERGILYTEDMRTLVRAPGGIEGEARIPDAVEEIGGGAFQGCSKLESVVLGGGLRTISENAFKGCSSLRRASLGGGLESIGKYAFFGCGSLESIDLPDSIERVGTWAFGECGSLATASVPASLELLQTAFPEGTEVSRRRGGLDILKTGSTMPQ